MRRAAVRVGPLLLAASLAASLVGAQVPDLTPLDLAHVADVVGAPRAARLVGEALESEALRVAEVLRCPVCQGLSVADSPSTMATHMRQQVRELVAAGFDEEQVLSYFEASYGEFVRLEPPLRGVNWLVWLAPLGGLAVGGAVVYWALRGAAGKSGAAGSATPSPAADSQAPRAAEAAGADPLPKDPLPEDALPEDPALARALLRVRETAYGWPGGRRPEGS